MLGIGVTVDNLTFVHVIEDTIKDKFPVKTRSDEIYNCTCIDRDGHQKTIHTLVATKAVSNRDVTAFFEREIPQEICTRITRQGMCRKKPDHILVITGKKTNLKSGIITNMKFCSPGPMPEILQC